VNSKVKIELIFFNNELTDKETCTNFKEIANTKPTYLPKYDSNFWKGYNVIEPNQAIKEFKSLE